MKITRLENGDVQVQLYKRHDQMACWVKVFDFVVTGDEWIELKHHMLDTINAFEA